MLENLFASDAVAEAFEIVKTEFPLGLWETFYVTVFGILSALISSYIASRKVMSFKIAEVLHDE